MKNQEFWLGLAIVSLLVLLSEATVLFHNTGTVSGWDSINQVLLLIKETNYNEI